MNLCAQSSKLMKATNTMSSAWRLLFPGIAATLAWLSWEMFQTSKAGISQGHVFDAIAWSLLHNEFGILLLALLWIFLSIIWLAAALFRLINRRREVQVN